MYAHLLFVVVGVFRAKHHKANNDVGARAGRLLVRRVSPPRHLLPATSARAGAAMRMLLCAAGADVPLPSWIIFIRATSVFRVLCIYSRGRFRLGQSGS